VQTGEAARGPADEPSGVEALAQRRTIDGDVVPAVADNTDEQLGGRGAHARAVGECVHEDVEPAVSGQGLVQVDLVREGNHPGMTDQTLAEIEADIEARDLYDSTREHSPLKQAEDAILVDTSHETLDSLLAKLTEMIQKRM